ncbi:aldehyde dehydrogenase family protein [Aneurinibacillus migulanus]|uniref:Betaine-aldehyde dehydrogenase n=1 Tax=Aneurinibacillus migulanus TaxID=47500 RepID=A0A0M0GLP0_ANEMI|nr:aldehyde dehydrogenase family protein [Aneurinibacillus migulanus]KON90845.1 betaine-aldehyde dehydrogenase [Aneurinibacillus migulanus]MED0890677.1 aldehyde dehydrogenase family protein [Aneurinibacillus migulanus]MED1617143.1 aldehyde dehydrogenase family protein [Aneurinibacillus migulanus]MED4731342.1 aldehyde dehydrogenase family protein [Aneurinibacillus migulanus]SDJ23994.1 betaine-aldehyde dehydrogenase [Aneurinibacillus migulanus]
MAEAKATASTALQGVSATQVLKMFIDGQWVESASGETRNVINPANGEVIAVTTEGTVEDVRKAVAAAKRAFYEDGWMETPASERARLLFEVANKLEQRAEEFAYRETIDNGKPLRETEFDVADTVACFRYYAGIATKPHGQTYEVADPMQAMVVREPIGVVGQIIPWNYPLLMSAWKLAPALAAGNTVIFKPSEVTPVNAIKLFEIFEEVGFPKGVVNLVLGAGATVGNEIATNFDIDKVAFTGGTATGRSIMQAATGNLKKISLELGGKSPNIVFADADFEAAVDYALFGIFCNQGQVCSAGSRLLLEESIYDKFIERLVERAKQIKVGPGTAEDTEMGPLVSEAHMEKVLSYIQIGKEEDGATLVCGGNRITEGELGKGFFVEPTIFVDTTPNMRIVQEEIFGPVLVVQKFKDEADAIYLANDTVYGLAGAVFTQDGAKAQRVIRKLRAGITWINAYHPTYNEAPWGGYKQSGIGRELGTFGFEEYTEVKQININLQVEPTGWFKN